MTSRLIVVTLALAAAPLAESPAGASVDRVVVLAPTPAALPTAAPSATLIAASDARCQLRQPAQESIFCSIRRIP